MGDQGPLFFFKPDDRDYGWLCQWYWSPFTAEVDGKTLEFKHAEQWVSSLHQTFQRRSLNKSIDT